MKKKQRYTLKYDGEKIEQIVTIQQKDGAIINPVIDDSKSRSHFHSHKRDSGFGHHTTNEDFPKGDNRRHTGMRTTGDEPMINTTLAGLSPDGVTPPTISDIRDEQQLKILSEFLNTSLGRLIHQPLHRQLKIPVGAAARLGSSLLSALESGADFEIDLKKEIESEDFKGETFETIMEDELRAPDKTWGFTLDDSRVVILLKEGKEGFVMELNLKAYLEAQDNLLESSGFNDFIESQDIQKRITDKMRKQS